MAKKKIDSDEETIQDIYKDFLRFSRYDKTRLTKDMKLALVKHYIKINAADRLAAIKAAQVILAKKLWLDTMTKYLDSHNMPPPAEARMSVDSLKSWIYSRLPSDMVNYDTDVGRLIEEKYIQGCHGENLPTPRLGWNAGNSAWYDILKKAPEGQRYVLFEEEYQQLDKVRGELERKFRPRLNNVETLGDLRKLMPDALEYYAALVQYIPLTSQPKKQKRVVTGPISDDAWLDMMQVLGKKQIYEEPENAGT